MSDKARRGFETSLTDLTRTSVVLAVASMDTYFTARFAEMLVSYLKKHGAKKSLVETLKNAGLDTTQALEMLQMERPYRRIRSLMDAYLERFTTQRIDVIDELFLCYGLKDLSVNSQKLAKRKNPIRRVEKIVERRHQIVHAGDLNSHNKLQDIDPDETKRQIGDLKLFVNSAHQLTLKIK